MPIDIVIQNPNSPALGIWLTVCGIILVLGIMAGAAHAYIEYDVAMFALWSISGFLLSVLLFGFSGVTIKTMDERAIDDRISERLEYIGFENVHITPDDTFTAADPDGLYVEGVIREIDSEHYKVYFD